jgi:hypothetical protein
MEQRLLAARNHEGDSQFMDQFAEMVEKQIRRTGKDYLAAIQSLAPAQAQIGTRWLQSIIDHLTQDPSLQI